VGTERWTRVRIGDRADVRGIRWKPAGRIEARRHKDEHLASLVEVSCVLRASCLAAPRVHERRIENVHEHGTRHIERVRDLEAYTYHAVDNDGVGCEIIDFSSNVISRARAKQGGYHAFFPSLLKSNP
jgi:hypothetical protein